MSLRVVITPEAAADIVDARTWYDSQETGAGDRFYQIFRKRIHDALKNLLLPRAWGRRKIRKLRISKYPYSIYYEINAEELQIIAVVHGARNPKYLNDRLR